jgi:putative membrane protein
MTLPALFYGTSFLAAHVTGGQAVGHWHMHGWDNMMDYGYGGILMWIALIALAGLVAYLVVVATKGGYASRTEPEHRSGETAMDILRKRYAKGELSKEEFDRMKADLK